MSNWIKSLLKKSTGKKRYYQAIFPTDGCQYRAKIYDVPINIPRPHYVTHGEDIIENFSKRAQNKLYNDIEGCRRAGKLARKVMNYALESIAIGMMADMLDKLIHQKIVDLNAYPSLLDYRKYVRSTFISVNNIANHGIPDYRYFTEGDIVTIDFAVFYEGYHSDIAETVIIGDIDKYGIELVQVAKKCTDACIAACKDGKNFIAISNACRQVANAANYAIIPHFVGHGIGRDLYETPEIYYDGTFVPGKMETGMIFTIEPVIVEGRPNVYQWPNQCTYATKDKGRAAKFERTILVTEDGAEVLT